MPVLIGQARDGGCSSWRMVLPARQNLPPVGHPATKLAGNVPPLSQQVIEIIDM
jgi:hypothetical protein